MLHSRHHSSKTVRNFGIEIQTFFEEDEISYKMAKFGHSRTIFTIFTAFQSLILTLNFFVIFRNRLDLNGLIGNLGFMIKTQNGPN